MLVNHRSRQYFFDRVFIAFPQCLLAFQHYRPVLSVDATHLSGKHQGKMFTALGVDAYQMLLPLAFMVAEDVETTENWSWFLRRIRVHCLGDHASIYLISDRHKGIKAAVHNPLNGWTPPLAHHRFCLQHFCSNFKSKFKDQTLKEMLWRAGIENQPRKFNRVMCQMKEINPHAWQWLQKEPLETWALCHDGGIRYGIMTTNLSEGFNGVMKGIRSLPITVSIQMIFFRLVRYFFHRLSLSTAVAWSGACWVSFVNEKVEYNREVVARHQVTEFHQDDGHAMVTMGRRGFEMRKGGNIQNVQLRERTCTCGKWQNLKYPCSHVIAACNAFGISMSWFIDRFYGVEEYAATWTQQWRPYPHDNYWPDYEYVLHPNPLRIRTVGRPKLTRFRNEMDMREASRADLRCGICRQPGHNRKRCPSRQT